MNAVAVVLGAMVLFSSLMFSAQASITVGAYPETYYGLLYPLGDMNGASWSFEGDPPPGWWSNYGGHRCSTYKLDSSYSWHATGSSSGNYIMERYVESGCLNAIKGQYVEFAFNYLPNGYNSQGSVNKARAVLIVYSPYGTNYYYGVWITPTQSKWYIAHVNAYVLSYATSVTVRIEGSTSFNAWIDVATLAIRDTYSYSSSKGKFGVNINLYKNAKESAAYPGVVFIAPALFAEAASGYYIRATKIYIELQPVQSFWSWGIPWPPGTHYYTTQQGKIYIWYCEQSNNLGMAVDPAANDAARNSAIAAVGTAIDVAVGVGTALIEPTKTSTKYILVAVAAGEPIIAKWLLSLFASNANDREAATDVSNEDFSAHEQWDYPTYCIDYPRFISVASAGLEFDWRFKYDTNTKFQIKITCSVNWGTMQFTPGSPRWGTPDKYSLVDAGWDQYTSTITIYA